jgi:hypothetical protein
MTRQSINKPKVEVSLYMAFPDGVFHYVCAECTALCCRGQGFGGSLKREMPVLLQLYPALGSAVVSRQASMLAFGTPAGRCFFLDEDNFCRIEKDHGKALKPGVCSLFPFNRFTRIGKVIAVSPHFMCPIRLQLPARPGHVEGTHSSVDAAVRESGLLDSEFVDGYMQPVVLHESVDADAVLKREVSFRDTCSRSLGRARFFDVLREESSDPSALDSCTRRAAEVMGLEANHADRGRDNVDTLLLALAPSHRLSLLHMSSESILRALAIGEVVLRQTMSLSSIQVTPQGANSIMTNVGPAVRLLARGDETIELARNTKPKSPQFGDPYMSFAAFTALRQLGAGTGVLAALEKAIKPDMTIPDRSALLVQLGSQLEHTRLKRTKKQAINNNAESAG